MRIGLICSVHGTASDAPSFQHLKAKAQLAEAIGFDSFVFEDVLLYRGETQTQGVWESMTLAGALLEATTKLEIGQSVINSPYRSPAMTASMVSTLDEISAGRYVFGIGAGNTSDSDYEAFGFPKDHRFSRFSEAIQIIHSLLKTGRCDFKGEFYEVVASELVLRGPRAQGPPINIAGAGPKMLDLINRYADAWNWWIYDSSPEQAGEALGPLVAALDRSDLVKTVDVYSVVPPGMASDLDGRDPWRGTADELADEILSLGELGFSEVRCDLLPDTLESIEAMRPVIELVKQA